MRTSQKRNTTQQAGHATAANGWSTFLGLVRPESGAGGSSRFGHDSSRIPIHPAPFAGIQRKLTIAGPVDACEQEAERVADGVLADSTGGVTFLPVQRYAADGGSTGQMPRGASRVLTMPGEPLQPALRHEMETRFGHDFSRVRIHHDRAAEESAREANAEAYTAGHHIVFGAGPRASDARQAKRVLAHELTHVVQQSRGGNAVQKLIRTPYPWRGVIVPAIGAHIRSAPNSTDPANILDSIPHGQPVNVLSASGDWLRVESKYRSAALVGYIYHPLVDDATSASMTASVGSTMVWRPSGPTSGTDFQLWASAAAEAPFSVKATTVMNCWEAVLLAAYHAGAIDWKWINKLYTATPTGDWMATMSRGAQTNYAVPGPNLKMPQRGDLVFFKKLAHVALATGKGSEVLTFWPPPNTPFTMGGTTDKVKVFTIEELVTWWGKNIPPEPDVKFVAPAW